MPRQVGNPGRVVIGASAIKAWLDHNMEAKRPVMAKLAAVLERKARPVAMARLAATLRLKVRGVFEDKSRLNRSLRLGFKFSKEL